MAIQAAVKPQGSDISPDRYSEQRAPQFVGGSTDPTTGNVLPASRSSIAQGSGTPTLTSPTDPSAPPQSSETRLGDMNAAPSKPSMGGALTKAALGAAVPYIGAQIGSQVGAGSGLGEAVSGLGSHVGNALGFGGGASQVPIGSTQAADTGMNLSGLTDLAGASSLGGAVGAGLGTAAVGILSGQQIKEWGPSAVGSAVGFAIGNVLVPGIGGFVGSAAGSFLAGLFDW